MSSFEFTESDTWNGRPVSRKISEAVPRERLVVTGLILDSRSERVGGSVSGFYVLDDGTGQVGLLFLGQPSVVGFDAGTCVTIEGTPRVERDRLIMWNPIYRLEPTYDD